MAIGQHFLKLAASRTELIDYFTNSLIYFAFLYYALLTILWVYLLTKFSLQVAYPIASTAVIIMPFISWVIYKEKPCLMYFVGVFILIVGLCVTVLSASNSLNHVSK